MTSVENKKWGREDSVTETSKTENSSIFIQTVGHETLLFTLNLIQFSAYSSNV
jgi:hypothetical protein